MAEPKTLECAFRNAGKKDGLAAPKICERLHCFGKFKDLADAIRFGCPEFAGIDHIKNVAVFVDGRGQYVEKKISERPPTQEDENLLMKTKSCMR